MTKIARHTKTGKYFNGTNFDATYYQDAKVLPKDTTAEDFKLSWGNNVEIVEIPQDPTPLKDAGWTVLQ